MASNTRNRNRNGNEDAIEFTLKDILKYIPSEMQITFGNRDLDKLYRLLPKNTNNDYSVFSSDEEEGIFDLANILQNLVIFSIIYYDSITDIQYLDIVCLIYSRFLHRSKKFNIYKKYINDVIKSTLISEYISTLSQINNPNTHHINTPNRTKYQTDTINRIKFIFTYLIDNINFDVINTEDINGYRYSHEISFKIMQKIMELEKFLIDYKFKRRGLILKHQKNTCYYNNHTMCYCNRCTRRNNRTNGNRANRNRANRNRNRATCNNCKRNAGGVCPKHR